MDKRYVSLTLFFAEVGSTTSENLKSIILGLGMYFPPVNVLSKQKRAMRRRMMKPHGLKVRFYAVHMIDLNEKLSVFPRENASEKICGTERNEILLNSIPNR